MAEELIDIYDEKMNLLGTATREQAHREGLWHTSFHCWIVRRSPDTWPPVKRHMTASKTLNRN